VGSVVPRLFPSVGATEGFFMDALLFAHGLYTRQDEAFLRRLSHDLIIAVDGGLHRLLQLNLRPHVYVGDVDSADPAQLAALEREGLRVLRFPRDKDQTDLELAALYAVERGADTLHFFAALGGRWDQSLANLLLALHPAMRGRRLYFYADGQVLFPVYRRAVVRGQPGDTVSFLPLEAPVRGVTLKGFRYLLEDGEFQAGSTLGVSNVLEASEGVVEVREGVLLGVHLPQGIQQRIEAGKHSNPKEV